MEGLITALPTELIVAELIERYEVTKDEAERYVSDFIESLRAANLIGSSADPKGPNGSIERAFSTRYPHVVSAWSLTRPTTCRRPTSRDRLRSRSPSRPNRPLL